MKQIVFGIFAHPDDEAFGPAATLCQAVADGAELHLVCVTDGAQGQGTPQQRHHEWQAAGQLIGAQHMHYLGYGDGQLCNNLYHEIAHKIIQLIQQSCAAHESSQLSLVTFDTNGLTGHLDHIAVSYITTYVFHQLKKSPPAGTQLKELAYFCYSLQQQPVPDLDYFVYAPAGRSPDFIDRQTQIGPLMQQKEAIVRAHKSQEKDVAAYLARDPQPDTTENFRVIT